jgi:hypothetical protein
MNIPKRGNWYKQYLTETLQKEGTGNREQGTDKKQKLLSLKLSQKKDVF